MAVIVNGTEVSSVLSNSVPVTSIIAKDTRRGVERVVFMDESNILRIELSVTESNSEREYQYQIFNNNSGYALRVGLIRLRDNGTQASGSRDYTLEEGRSMSSSRKFVVENNDQIFAFMSIGPSIFLDLGELPEGTYKWYGVPSTDTFTITVGDSVEYTYNSSDFRPFVSLKVGNPSYWSGLPNNRGYLTLDCTTGSISTTLYSSTTYLAYDTQTVSSYATVNSPGGTTSKYTSTLTCVTNGPNPRARGFVFSQTIDNIGTFVFNDNTCTIEVPILLLSGGRVS